jgi:hypothetical protein
MRPPAAYHLTWTCYGQWLHGDARGYVDRLNRAPGAPYPPHDPRRFNAAANRMAETPCLLGDRQRLVAEAAPASSGKHAMAALKRRACPPLTRGTR